MSICETDPLRTAEVVFGRVRQSVSLLCVPQAQVGDWVMVHAGMAIALDHSLLLGFEAGKNTDAMC